MSTQPSTLAPRHHAHQTGRAQLRHPAFLPTGFIANSRSRCHLTSAANLPNFPFPGSADQLRDCRQGK
jgi:hypothetical protein